MKQETTKRPVRRRRRWFITNKALVVEFVLLCIFGLVLYFLAQINKPGEAVIITRRYEDTQQLPATKTSTLKGRYFSLQYTGQYDEVNEISDQDRNALEAYRVEQGDITNRRTIVVTVRNAPQGGITEDSSYKLRALKPDTYTESRETLGEHAFITMQKIDPYELVGFVAHGGRMATIAYIVNQNDGKAREQALELFSTFRWAD